MFRFVSDTPENKKKTGRGSRIEAARAKGAEAALAGKSRDDNPYSAKRANMRTAWSDGYDGVTFDNVTPISEEAV